MHIEIETRVELETLLSQKSELHNYAFQNLDFTGLSTEKHRFTNCLFLGCTIPSEITPEQLGSSLVFPIFHSHPYNPFRAELYTKETLFTGYEVGNQASYENTPDKKIYDHTDKGKESDDIYETLARRLHDNSITDAMYDFLEGYDEKKVVAIMGGHGLSRADASYADVVRVSKVLTETGYLMISGGGPGAMEATHVGAWLAGQGDDCVDKAVAILAEAPMYTDKGWLDKSFQVMELFPNVKFESLGIPTWLYGHEPPTPFATKIAKYFANSVREDGLLTIAMGGVIFSPGSAGTLQEIFQDACQNHYKSFGYASPMIFLNRKFWTEKSPIYPLLTSMLEAGRYKNLILSSCDTAEEVVAEIEKFK